jgi:HlyD family secretion protein
MRTIRLAVLALLAVAGGVAYYFYSKPPSSLVLTGIVTTNDVMVSAQISGRIAELRVQEGDVVKRDQVIALMTPEELKAEHAYYSQSAEGLASQVSESEAALRYQEQQTAEQIHQAEAMLASTVAQQTATAADLEQAQLGFTRAQTLLKQGLVATEAFDRARTELDAAKARLDSLNRNADAQRAAVALARVNAEQILMRRSALKANQHQHAAAAAQTAKAEVRLAYTELRAPIDGFVDVRAARPGEVVTPGQAVVTLINPDDLWVRADVEESYIDRVRIGDTLTVRLPSGEERKGTVFYRRADAGFATQRDVSRTKRDIKTFEVRLRVDNTDRRLAVGMTAYVLLQLS